MSTPAQVKAGLDQIAARISNQRDRILAAKASLESARDELTNIPTEFAAVKAAIDGYTPTGAFETLAKDELSKLAAEFTALKNDAIAAITALS